MYQLIFSAAAKIVVYSTLDRFSSVYVQGYGSFPEAVGDSDADTLVSKTADYTPCCTYNTGKWFVLDLCADVQIPPPTSNN